MLRIRIGNRWLRTLAAAALIAPAATSLAGPGRYLEIGEFLESVFDTAPATSATLYVDATLRSRIETALGHSFQRLRIHYWSDGATTAWVLDEIGKTEPITIGVAIERGRVKSVRILEFRESRGWEIQYPFFTDQYRGAGLSSHGRIDRRIDGITGATLSVTAVEKIVRVALYCDEAVTP